MMPPMDKKNVLKLPEGVTASGPVMDATEAYLKAVIALPEILLGVLEDLGRIGDALSVIALYAEKKGIDEGLIVPDVDLEESAGSKHGAH